MTTAPGAAARSTGAGILFLLATVFFIAVMDMFVKLLTQSYPMPVALWGRYTFHFALLLPLLVTVGPRRLLSTRRPVLQVMRSLALFVTTALLFLALHRLQLAEVTAIMFTSPLIATALSVPLLGERVGFRRWTGVLVGFAAVLIIVRPGTGVIGWAALLPLGAAACYALYQISTRILSRSDETLTTLFYTALIGTLATNLIVPFYWQTPAATDWGLLVLVGALGAVAHLLFIKAYSLAPPAVLGPFVYTQLIWATTLGLIVFSDFPDAWTIVGAVIITASGLYIWHREHRIRPVVSEPV